MRGFAARIEKFPTKKGKRWILKLDQQKWIILHFYFFDLSDEKTEIIESMPPAARHTRWGWKVRQETAAILEPKRPPPSWYAIVERTSPSWSWTEMYCPTIPLWMRRIYVREIRTFDTEYQFIFYQANRLALEWTAIAVIPCELGVVATVRTEVGFLWSINFISPARLEEKKN